MFSFESKNAIVSLLDDRKKEILKEHPNSNVIPFIVYEDAYINQRKISNINRLMSLLGLLCFITCILLNSMSQGLELYLSIVLILLCVIIYFIIKTKYQNLYLELKHKLKYFSINQTNVSIFEDDREIGIYPLKDIKVKPKKYLADVYIYEINCPNLILGDCYIKVDDSLNSKNTFTFLGNNNYDKEKCDK